MYIYIYTYASYHVVPRRRPHAMITSRAAERLRPPPQATLSPARAGPGILLTGFVTNCLSIAFL